ncbi:MAG TPA: hypothetical protein VIY48_14045 [Candidatus Paceibacterota bacterium]
MSELYRKVAEQARLACSDCSGRPHEHTGQRFSVKGIGGFFPLGDNGALAVAHLSRGGVVIHMSNDVVHMTYTRRADLADKLFDSLLAEYLRFGEV